jgi:hypothetical protein
MFVWVKNKDSHINVRILIEGVLEEGDKENILT